MDTGAKKKILSADTIRERYFAGSAAPASRTELKRVAHSVDELTPSARFVAKEAKKRMGQRSADVAQSALNEKQLYELVRCIESIEGEELGARERTAVVAALSASLDHYDILTPLISNPEVNDIIIRAYNDISVQIGRGNNQTDLCFPDHEAYKSFVENLLKRAGKSCTTATPVVDAAIDPHVRACVTHESFSPPGSGPMLTLRIARHREISLNALTRHELAPSEVLDYLGLIVEHSSATLLIAGEVGTGKTTLAKALASRIPEDEAILIIEDTNELVLQRRFVRNLLTREANTEGVGRISPAEAIRAGMRMAMNRVILGEMRDAETAEAFIDVCASGHAGMSTIHARSARDALSRLELFLARAQGNIDIRNIRRQIANAVSVVVYLGLDKRSKKRRIVEVLEVGTSADGAIQVSPLYTFAADPVPHWRRDGGISLFTETLADQRFALAPAGTKLFVPIEQTAIKHSQILN